MGRALYEIADYQEAERAFQASRRVDGSRLKVRSFCHRERASDFTGLGLPLATPHTLSLQDLDIYSTVLWHLRREVELAHLSQEVVALDRQSPVVWCILGNCFSLQKDKDTAIRFFQRALQLDPTFAYAYTLSGHEYFASDDLGKALTCYRNAIRIDPRHYNAWCGCRM